MPKLMRISFQINIDFHTREATARKIKAATPTCFDEAQKIIYTLMEKDSYPRFLKSNRYLNLLNDLQANSLKWPVPGCEILKMVSSPERMYQPASLGEHSGLWGWVTGPEEEAMTQNGLTWQLSRLRAREAWDENREWVEGRRRTALS